MPDHSPPKILEPIRRQLGVPNRMLDVLVPEVLLQDAGVVAIVGQLEPAGVAQHVRVDGKRHPGGLTEARHEVVKAERAHRPAAFGNEHIGFGRAFTP